ncbi:MAG: hypothetical protein ACLQBX_00110 [Candidatus Limnocylindrales bacterium]
MVSLCSELGEGPDVVERVLGEAAGEVATLARSVRRRTTDLVLIAARGSSDHAAIYAQCVLGARNGLDESRARLLVLTVTAL